jgi:hypothetical protein
MNHGSPRQCDQCGKPLGEGASFCRACGTKYQEPTPDEAPTAVGDALPPVEPAPPFRPAPKPPRAHPGPGQHPGRPPTQKPGGPSAPAKPGAPTTPQPLPPLARPTRRSRTPLVVGAIILTLGAGSAAVVLGTQDLSSDSGAPTPAEVRTAAPEETASPGETEAAAGRGFPSVGRAQMTEEIQTLLLAYHRDVVDRDFTAAWTLLSPRKRQQYLDEGGYHKWMAAQASLSPYLSLPGLTVRLDALEGEGVARVMVTGMGWSKPDSPCSEWSGLTWVRYQGGEWRYDPGYSTTPSRRQTWQPRFHELLGADC